MTEAKEETGLTAEEKINKDNNKSAYLWAFIAVTLWAGGFPGVKYALNFYSPESIMLFRFCIASAALSVIAILTKAKLPAVKDLPYLIIGGTVNIFIYMWLFNTGTDYVKSGVSSFIIAANPIYSYILAVLFLNEKILAKKVLGLFISFIGLVLIALSQVTGFTMNIGVFILIGASVCMPIYNIIQRKLRDKYTAIEMTVYSVIAGTVEMFIFFPGFIAEYPSAPLSANIVIILMGIFPGAIAYLTWAMAIVRTENMTNITIFNYLTPFIATTIAYFALGEVLSPLALFGGVVIIGGMLFSNLNFGRKKIV